MSDLGYPFDIRHVLEDVRPCRLVTRCALALENPGPAEDRSSRADGQDVLQLRVRRLDKVDLRMTLSNG